MHFNLGSDGVLLHHDEDYIVHAGGASYPLKKHDEVSRAKFQRSLKFLREDSEPEPTHYVEDVILPRDKVTRFHLTQTSDDHGTLDKAHEEDVEHGLALVGLHIPDEVSADGAKFLRQGDPDNVVSGVFDPTDIAQTILFHHPDLMNMNPRYASRIMRYILRSSGFSNIVSKIQDLGPHEWYSMRPLIDESGDQLVTQADHDGDGEPDHNPLYAYEISDEVKKVCQAALQNVLTSTKNDPALEGQSWHVQEGTSHLEEPDPSADATSWYMAKLQPYQLTDNQNFAFSLDKTGFHNGLRTNMTYDGNSVTLKVRNDWVRHLSLYVRFYDENDTVISPDSWSSSATDSLTLQNLLGTDTLKFLSLVNPVPLIMGIPVAGDYTEVTVGFHWPPKARYALLLAGGLGNGGTYRDWNVELMGATMTSVFELAIPTVLLAANAAMGVESALLKSMWDDVGLISSVVSFFLGVAWGHSDWDMANVAAKLGRLAADVVWKSKSIRNYMILKITEANFEQAIPFIGWALHVLDMAATVSALTQTSVETAMSPWIIDNRIAPTHDLEVTIKHDVDDYQFPATATHYKVIATFSHTYARTEERQLPGTTVSAPQTVVLEDVPAGGYVDLKVLFYSNTGWLAGQAEQTHIENINTGTTDRLSVELIIEENLVPLDEESVYTHKQRLAYDTAKGKHVWQAGAAPTATSKDLSNEITGNALSGLTNVTVSQKLGTLGYVYRAYSPNFDACPGNTSGGHLYSFQNISLTEDPELGDPSIESTGLMTATCGYSEPPYLLYDFRAPKASAQNFVVVPEGEEYYVRKMTYSTDGTFTVPTDKAYGKFMVRVDSLLHHPHGYLIAINHSESRMFSLQLLDEPVADADAPPAIPVATPAITMAGLEANPSLLRKPVALKLTPEGGGVMILDDIHELTENTDQERLKARLKVFTPDGTPVPYFAGDAYYLDLLEPQDGMVTTYLDFGIEGQGYVYVLSSSVPKADASYQPDAQDYHLDIYEPDGTWLVRTDGVAADKLTVDLWRNLKTLNYEMIVGKNGRTEPSVSEWIPPTPPGTEE